MNLFSALSGSGKNNTSDGDTEKECDKSHLWLKHMRADPRLPREGNITRRNSHNKDHTLFLKR